MHALSLGLYQETCTSLTLTAFFSSFESSLQNSSCVLVVQALEQGEANHGPQVKYGLSPAFVKQTSKQTNKPV